MDIDDQPVRIGQQKRGVLGNLMDVEHDPADLPTDILDIWAQIPEAERERALTVLKAFPL